MRDGVVVIPVVIVSLVILVVAAAVILVTWLGTRPSQVRDDSRLVEVCETISDLMNGDSDPRDALTTLVGAGRSH